MQPNVPVTVISLTSAGEALARRLSAHGPMIEMLHRPQPYQETVRRRFLEGHRLVLIGAIGIAVRTLAPVLRDKYHDPAVLVLDEHGRFVVPILSGHEGGANEWARQIAALLGAQAVITGAQQYTQPLLIGGVGCNRGCGWAPLLALCTETLQQYGLQYHDLHALASIDIKQDEAVLHQLAAHWQLPLHFYAAPLLNQYTGQLTRRSEAVFRATGCYGVAEAAALAHAEVVVGHAYRAELIIPKQKNADATFAVARVYTNVA